MRSTRVTVPSTGLPPTLDARSYYHQLAEWLPTLTYTLCEYWSEWAWRDSVHAGARASVLPAAHAAARVGRGKQAQVRCKLQNPMPPGMQRSSRNSPKRASSPRRRPLPPGQLSVVPHHLPATLQATATTPTAAS